MLTDISELCEKFNISSRTLRFYEEEGLIESTREEESTRRKYTESQIERVREILTLRAIGIPVREIKAYLEGDTSLKEVIMFRKAEIIASVNSKMKEIALLNDTLMAIEEGENVLDASKENRKNSLSELSLLARTCGEHIVRGELEKLYQFFSKKIIEYMPMEAFAAMWRDTIEGMGEFAGMGDTIVSDESEQIIFQLICFEKVKVRIKFVFHNNIIHGVWTDYVE